MVHAGMHPVGRSSRRRLASRFAAAVVVAGSLALSACAGDGGTDGGSDGELSEMTVVTFLPLKSFTFTPEMLAASGGFFEKHGLDVTIEPVKGTAAAVQSVIGGAALVTRASTVDILPAMEEGQPIRAIGTMTYSSPLRMPSVESNPLESAADLEGSTIGMGSVGGTSEKMLNLTLRAAGIPLDSVERQVVPVTAATLELVRQGQLDGYIVGIDTALGLASQNDDVVVDDVGLGDTPDIQTWLTTEQNLQDPEKVEKIEKYLAAIREAVQFVIDDADNDFAEVLSILREDWSFPALEDDEVAQTTLERYTTQIWVDATGETELLHNPLDRWTEAYEIYAEAGLVEGGQDPQEWITDEYIPEG